MQTDASESGCQGGEMPKVEIIRPFQQVTGQRRLLAELKNSLAQADFNELRIVVAYAKSGPLHRLRADLEAWRKAGKRSAAIIGIDQQGTSKEALELALELFDEVFITREKGVTFHPKAYIFEGSDLARFYIGSNNLTVGGTETNFEASIIVDVDITKENALYGELRVLWDELLPTTCAATQVLSRVAIDQLVEDGHVLGEAVLVKQRLKGRAAAKPVVKSGILRQPPTPLPLSAKRPANQASSNAGAGVAVTATVQSTVNAGAANGFAIQIRPQPNGEIHLSVSAALQNPAFFDFPFNGMTVPKKVTGTPYPQRLPDPRVNIQVYGAGGVLMHQDIGYDLNTVFYERRREIRITASQLVPLVPAYSVMIMRPGSYPGIDYDIEIHTPASPDYSRWVAACNQEMPGGGKTPRRYGWF